MIVNSIVRLFIILTDLLITLVIVKDSLFLLQDIIAFVQFFITPLCFTAYVFFNRGLQPSHIAQLSILTGTFISLFFIFCMYQFRGAVNFYPLAVTIVACLLVRGLAIRRDSNTISGYFLYYFLVKNVTLLLILNLNVSVESESLYYLISLIVGWLCLISLRKKTPNIAEFEALQAGRFLQFYGLSLLAQFIVQGEVIYLLLIRPGDEVADYRLLLQLVLVGNLAQQVVNQTYIRKISNLSASEGLTLWFFGRKSIFLASAIYTCMFLLLAVLPTIDVSSEYIFHEFVLLTTTSLPTVHLYTASAMMLLMYGMGPIITVAKLNLTNTEVTTIFFIGILLKCVTSVIIINFFTIPVLAISGPACMLVVSFLFKSRLKKKVEPTL